MKQGGEALGKRYGKPRLFVTVASGMNSSSNSVGYRTQIYIGKVVGGQHNSYEVRK